MLGALARNWSWLLCRALIAMAYGLLLFIWPNMRMVTFVFVFGIYVLVDGILALAIAVDVRDGTGFGSLLFESLVRIGAGFIAMGEPGVLVAVPRFIAIWSLLTGVAEATVAYVLRRELVGEWPLPLASAVSVTIALLLLLLPVPIGVPALRWLVGPYAIYLGVTLLALARRLREIAEEIRAA